MVALTSPVSETAEILYLSEVIEAEPGYLYRLDDEIIEFRGFVRPSRNRAVSRQIVLVRRDVAGTPGSHPAGTDLVRYYQQFAPAPLDASTGEGGGPHTHPESDVTGLSADLTAKAPTDHSHDDYATDTDLSDHAATTHGTSAHAISGVLHTGSLDHSALGSVTANQHHNQSHALGGGDHSGSLAQASVMDLVTDLAGKAATDHGHDYADPDHTHTLTDSDIPSAIARDAEVTSAIATHAATPHGGSSEAYGVGDIYLTTVDHANAAAVATHHGYGTWARFGVGRFLLLTDTAAEIEAGSDTHSHSFTQPSDHAALTHSGAAVAAHTFTQPTAAGEAAHTHTYTQTVNHVHVQTVNSATTGGLSGYTPDTSSNTPAVSGYSTQNPTGGVATGTTAAGSSHTHSMSGGAVDAHSVTQPNQHAAQSHSGGAVADGSTDPLSITAFAWKRTA